MSYPLVHKWKPNKGVFYIKYSVSGNFSVISEKTFLVFYFFPPHFYIELGIQNVMARMSSVPCWVKYMKTWYRVSSSVWGRLYNALDMQPYWRKCITRGGFWKFKAFPPHPGQTLLYVWGWDVNSQGPNSIVWCSASLIFLGNHRANKFFLQL